MLNISEILLQVLKLFEIVVDSGTNTGYKTKQRNRKLVA